jgi:hypothetical protein
MSAKPTKIRHHVLAILAGVAALAAASAANAATYYVNGSSGSDSNTGASDKPVKTIGAGLKKLASGDTLIVADGTYYDQANFINDGLNAIPSGTASAYTTIRAANPFAVRIRNTGAKDGETDYYESPLRIRGTRIVVDGFIFDLRDQSETPYVGEVGGSYNKVTRSIFRRQGVVDRYGGWMGVDGHHQLIEDVAGVGAARYGFFTGGPTSDANHIIFRRVVGRFDFSSSVEPKATFAGYGTDSGWGVHHILFQNCIAIDGQRGPNTGDVHYGAWYFPKNLDVGQVVGSIALNNSVAYSGMFVQELQGRSTLVSNSVSWGTIGASGIRWNGTGSINIDHVTVGGNTGDAAFTTYNNSVTAPVTQSAFAQIGSVVDGNGSVSFSNNAFDKSAQVKGSGTVIMTGIKYLPDASRDTGMSNMGAVILKRIGRSGTFYDDAGYDEVTTENLWPWPNEAIIKSVFAETNTPKSGNTPSTNNAIRGFTVATDQFGKTMTLTRYIWQYLGNEIPADLYTAKTPNPPSNLAAQ